jgi:hypothetical protein
MSDQQIRSGAGVAGSLAPENNTLWNFACPNCRSKEAENGGLTSEQNGYI